MPILIEHIGDVYAVGKVAGVDYARKPGLHRTMFSDGGKAFVVLPSTAKGGSISRISPSLRPGTPSGK